MRVLLINRFFGEPLAPTGRLAGDLATALSARGARVTVLAADAAYGRPASPGGSGLQAAPAAVRRIWAGPRNRRLLNWMLFWVQAAGRVLFGRWDRCVLLTDPPFMIALAGLLRGPRRAVYWWTMDLYPEALVAAGLIPAGGRADRLLRRINEFGMRRCAGIVCLGECQRRRLSAYRAFERCAAACLVEPPWDARPIRRVPPDSNWVVRRHGGDGACIALYAGNLGEGHTYADLLDAARVLHAGGDRHWRFVFCCRGAKRQALEREARGLPNVCLMDAVPDEQVPGLLWSACVHLITMADGWEGVVVPSKLFSVLQTDAPVLFVGPADADTAQVIERHRAGLTVPNGCGAERLIAALHDLERRPPRKPWAPDTAAAGRVARFIMNAPGADTGAGPGATI